MVLTPGRQKLLDDAAIAFKTIIQTGPGRRYVPRSPELVTSLYLSIASVAAMLHLQEAGIAGEEIKNAIIASIEAVRRIYTDGEQFIEELEAEERKVEG